MSGRVDFNVVNLVKQITQHKSEVEELCKPMLDFFGIRYFELYRVYPDNSFIILTTHPEWMQYYFTNHYFETTDTDCHNRLAQFDYILWDQWPEEDEPIWKITREANNFNLSNTITLILKFPDSINAFSYGAPIDSKNIYNKYLVNMSVLEKFSYFFLSKACKIIQQANQLKSCLPKINEVKGAEEFSLKNKILTNLDIEKVPIFSENKSHILTRMETKIIRRFIQGSSAKYIANKLHVSNRTIECHIANVKRKLDCNTKDQLCDKLIRSPIITHMVRTAD